MFQWGIYPEKAYTDEDTRPELKQLQNLIFTGLLKDVAIYLAFSEEEITEEVYIERLTEVEDEIMSQIKALCLVSKDAFFAQDLPDFLGETSSRLEAIRNIFPDNEDGEDFGGETQAEMAFEALEEEFMEQLLELANEMFSVHAIQDLCQKVTSEIELSAPEQQ